MATRLNVITVDDDPAIHETVKKFCSGSQSINIVDGYISPKAFLEALPVLNFDLCLLDIYMPEINGFDVADILKEKNKGVVFFSGVDKKLLKALELDFPIDVIPKPIKKNRLFAALEKARKIGTKLPLFKEYEVFHCISPKGKVHLKLNDIVHVRVDNTDCRNKQVAMKDGNLYVIGSCTLEKLLNLSPTLIQVNKTELISVDYIHTFDFDKVLMKGILVNGKNKEVSINRSYRKIFQARLESI